MGSKGRVPPPRRPLPGPGMMHPDPFVPGMRPPLGAFPYDMLPPPEMLEQKLATQHVEMQRLATENQRLAATHSILRQELATAQQELHRVQAHMGGFRVENDQQVRSLMDKIAKMEADLQAIEPVKMDLQKAKAESQNLIGVRQELISQVQQMTQELQRSHADVQKIPALISEVESLRQEYLHCRATYDYEKKLYNDHLESLQVMEKNYVTMVREVEKLRGEMANSGNPEKSGGQYGSNAAYKEHDTGGHLPVGQRTYEDGYGVPQGRGPTPGNVTAAYGGAPSGPVPARTAYDAPRGVANYEVPRGYESSQGSAGYDVSRGAVGYDAQRGSVGYDAQRGASAYDAQRGGSIYEAQRGSGVGYEIPRGAGMTQVAAAPGNTGPYGSTHTPTRAGGGYEAPSRSGNPGRR
ncbi:hypothetical protein QJS10_CPA05g01957 [Acorus calamus]|uniref:Protein FLX-like 2 n=1 Tax=Acorus calamus TaxID=4465 RepID=A0AAV9EUN0_ACOCL|nr:hypothetical protein QJS10_CPA05g01957 [Acorus calamus]